MSFVTEKLGWGSLKRHRGSVAIHLVWQWKIPVAGSTKTLRISNLE